MRFLPLSKYARAAKCLLRNKSAGDDVYPFYASFKLTSRCHFSCEFCNIREERDRPDLPLEKVKRILDNLSASSVVLVSFEGGEPLLRKDIGELLRYARSKDFYLLFTTSERSLEKYPMSVYGQFIDFLHISIDEGHNNMQMFERLHEYLDYGAQLSIQVVVSSATLPALESKVAKCHEAGVNMVIMPAVQMNRTNDHFPDIDRFTEEIARLKKLYPDTIYTPDGYGAAVKEGKCSTASIIIDSDGRLFYPCHILEKKGPDLSESSLMDYCAGAEAQEARKTMRQCDRHCGWFQYFSIRDFTSFTAVWKALKPGLSKITIPHK